jgi:branched-chain amino acid transport system ATP-binding protein
MRVELANVTAAYGDLVALRDVSLTVPPSRVVALLGANGAGKSTLLKVTSGLVRPRSGHVLLDDQDRTDDPAEARARLGICHVTEGRSVFPDLTVKDNLWMFAGPKGRSQAIEMAAEAFPRLGQRLGQIAGTMSGGEQQMLALARAYITGAPVVLLDEVSLGLAPIVVDEIFEFLHRLAAGGTSLLLVEQYAAKALAIADLVYILSRGRIVFAGHPSEVASSDLLSHYLGAGADELESAST